MSNVLIGIIGVILFIGLALAGALFLGPRFQESTNNSKASAAVQAVSQVASAANLYSTQEGRDAAVGYVDALRSAGYLKSVPGNPVGTSAPAIVSATGSDGTGQKPAVVIMSLGADAKAVCDAIIRQTGFGTSTASAITYTPSSDGTAGCKRWNTANGSSGVALNDYVVYAGI